MHFEDSEEREASIAKAFNIDTKYLHAPKSNHLKNEIYEDCDFYRVFTAGKKNHYTTIAIYHGLMYEVNQTAEERIKYIAKFSFQVLISLAVFIACAAYPDDFNKSWYVGLAEGMTMVSYSYVTVVGVIYLTAANSMRKYLYKMTSVKLIRACKMTAVMSGICAFLILSQIVINDFIIQKSAHSLLTGISVCSLLIMCCFLMNHLSKLESKRPFNIYYSKEQPPTGAEKLDYSVYANK
jgi:hypothetical protein